MGLSRKSLLIGLLVTAQSCTAPRNLQDLQDPHSGPSTSIEGDHESDNTPENDSNPLPDGRDELIQLVEKTDKNSRDAVQQLLRTESGQNNLVQIYISQLLNEDTQLKDRLNRFQTSKSQTDVDFWVLDGISHSYSTHDGSGGGFGNAIEKRRTLNRIEAIQDLLVELPRKRYTIDNYPGLFLSVLHYSPINEDLELSHAHRFPSHITHSCLVERATNEYRCGTMSRALKRQGEYGGRLPGEWCRDIFEQDGEVGAPRVRY